MHLHNTSIIGPNIERLYCEGPLCNPGEINGLKQDDVMSCFVSVNRERDTVEQFHFEYIHIDGEDYLYCPRCADNFRQEGREMHERCRYNVGCGWTDTICGKLLPCEKHSHLKCQVCGESATIGCGCARPLGVCGNPLCDAHKGWCPRCKRG